VETIVDNGNSSVQVLAVHIVEGHRQLSTPFSHLTLYFAIVYFEIDLPVDFLTLLTNLNR